jgi:hypothetical protein
MEDGGDREAPGGAWLPKYVKCVFCSYGGNPDPATKADPESAPAGFAGGPPGSFDGARGSRRGNFPEKFPGSGPGLGASPGDRPGQAGLTVLIFDLPSRQQRGFRGVETAA